MYFDNITNSELQYFHDFKVPNFSISLTQIFSSDLFKVEPVTTDNVYRIYPLFYTGKIVSSNSLDKILENKCIICKKNERETYLSFISDETAETVDFINYGSYYNIGNSLTTAQYNSIVQMYRANTVNMDNFNIKQGLVESTYGDYLFNIDSTTIVDTGILITDETLTSLGTVTLQNPVFHNSDYLLKLKVYHMTDINVCDDVNTDNIVVDTLSIPLETDVAKNIPFETLDYDYVIGFDAEVEITHTKPIINGVWVDDLILTADTNIIELGESVELTATLFDNTGTGVAGETVNFYDGSTLIGSDTTDDDGVVVYTYTPASVGDLTLTAVSVGLTSNPVVITVEHELILTNLSIDVPLVLIYSDEFQITGILTDEDNNVLTGASVDLYVGSTKVDTQTTDNTGKAEFTHTPVSTGNHSFQLKYSGDADYYSCESSVVSRTVGKETSVLNLSSPLDNETDYVDGSVSVAGTLLTDDGEAISNATVIISVDNVVRDSLTTDSNGDFDTSLNITVLGSHTITAIYGGNSNYNSSNESKTIYIVNASLSLSSNKNVLSYDDGEYAILTATLSSASPTGQSVELYDASDDSFVGTMTDNGDGTYSYSYSAVGNGDLSLYAKTGDLQSSNINIEDCLKYYDTVSQYFNNSNTIQSINRYTLPNDTDTFEITGKMKTNSSNVRISLGTKYTITFEDAGEFYQVQVNNGILKCNSVTVRNYTYNTDIDFKIVKEGSTIKFYVDNTLYDTQTNKTGCIYLCMSQWFATNNTLTITDLKIKPVQSIDITVDNPILSYADSTQANPQTATLTATVSPVAQGKTVNIYKDNTLIATEQTDSQGQVSYEYESQGVGDVEFIFESGTVSETYTIEDCIDYSPLTDNSQQSKWNISGQYSGSYSNNGWKISQPSNTFSQLLSTAQFNVPFSVEYDLNDYTNSVAPCPTLYIVNSNNTSLHGAFFFGYYNSQTGTWLRCTDASSISKVISENGVKGATYKLEVTASEVKLYKNNVLLGSKNCTNPSVSKIRMDMGGSRMMEIKNFKVKPL